MRSLCDTRADVVLSLLDFDHDEAVACLVWALAGLPAWDTEEMPASVVEEMVRLIHQWMQNESPEEVVYGCSLSAEQSDRWDAIQADVIVNNPPVNLVDVST